MAEITRELNRPRDLDATLDTIVRSAVRSLPGIDHVGITVAHRDGRIETRAATDQFVRDLDELQYELGQGPCVYAIEHEDAAVVTVEDVERDPRWPDFMVQAAKRGLRSQLGLRLYREEETLGGLNLYSTSSPSLNPETVQLAELFATHAALAFDRARREDQLNQAIATRGLIGKAIGIVMERYELTEERAFEYLVRVSSRSNLKLRDVADELVHGPRRSI